MAVSYPASWSSPGNVTASWWRVSRLVGTPLRCPYWPVSTVARLGAQMELVTKALAKSMPSAASRSMLGVSFKTDPYAETAWDA